MAGENDPLGVAPGAETSGTIPTLPKGDWKDPISAEIHAWLGDFVKAAKAHRVYAENNEMLVRFIDRAYTGLRSILSQVSELSLSVREDRLLYGKDAVHINNNREDGLPFVLYRNAFRRLTLVAGLERDELVKLMHALATDYSNFDFAGEDLVTALWRLSLPHLRYLTIDALSSDSKAAKDVGERQEIDRIQGNIEDIVAAIYQTNAPDEDIVAGVSITKEDLEALKEIRLETQEDLDLLDQATSRAIAHIKPDELRDVQTFLRLDSRDALVRRLMDILVRILFKEQSARESAGTIDLLSQLFDSMVVGHRFGHATELIGRLRHYAENSQNMQELHIARHLLRLFASESRVAPVLSALNEGYKSSPMSEMIGFLRALGPGVAPHLVGALDDLVAPAHRRLICDLIVELGVPDVAILEAKSANAKWFVVRDVLGLAQHFPPNRIAGLIMAALRHEHPKVRAHAVGMLRSYARGTADRLMVEHFADADVEVRMTAYRVGAMRKSPDAQDALRRIFEEEDLSQRDPKELRAMTASYAAIGGADAVEVLDELLNPGLLASFKDPEPQIAAAMALGAIGNEEAQAALQRGSRTLNPRVREAVKRAQTRHEPTADLDRKKLSKAELVDLPTPDAEEPSGYTLHPALRSEHPSPTPLPSIGNAADLAFSARAGSPGDPLGSAPEFRLPTKDLPPVAEPPNSVILRPRPIVPHAMKLEGQIDHFRERSDERSGPAEVAAQPFDLERSTGVQVDPSVVGSGPRISAASAELLRSVGASEAPTRVGPAPTPSDQGPKAPSASDLLRSGGVIGAREVMPERSVPRPSPPPAAPPPPRPNPSDLLRSAPTVGAREEMPRPRGPVAGPGPVAGVPASPGPAPGRSGPSVSDLLRSAPTVGVREELPGRSPPVAPPAARAPAASAPAPTADLGRPRPGQGLGAFPGTPLDPARRSPSQAKVAPPKPDLPPRVTGPVFPFATEASANEFDDESDEPYVPPPQAPPSAPPPRVAPPVHAPWPAEAMASIPPPAAPPPRVAPPVQAPRPAEAIAPTPPAPPRPAPPPVSAAPARAPAQSAEQLAALEDSFAEYLRSFEDVPGGKK